MRNHLVLSILFISLSHLSLSAQKELVKEAGSYDAIHLGGPFEVTLVEGKEGRIVFDGNAEDLEKVTYKIKNGALYIGMEKTRFWGSWNMKTEKIVVEIPVEEINELTISGSGKVSGSIPETADLKLAISGSGNLFVKTDVERLGCAISGSGDINASGRADEIKISISGSGNVNTTEIAAESVKVRIAGSGDAKIYATEQLDVSIAGSGDVQYKGNPKNISQSVAGSGKIRSF